MRYDSESRGMMTNNYESETYYHYYIGSWVTSTVRPSKFQSQAPAPQVNIFCKEEVPETSPARVDVGTNP